MVLGLILTFICCSPPETITKDNDSMAILSTKLPKDIVRRIFEFAYGVPTENKKRLIMLFRCLYEQMVPLKFIKDHHGRIDYGHYEKIQKCPKHYQRTDEEGDSGYENYYMEEKFPEEYPRNQLHMYKRYVRQLEQKIKNLEAQLQQKQKP